MARNLGCASDQSARTSGGVSYRSTALCPIAFLSSSCRNLKECLHSSLSYAVKFDGDWEVGLTSISKNSWILKKTIYRQYIQTDKVLGTDLICNQSAITDNVSFMKVLLQQLEWQRNTSLQRILAGLHRRQRSGDLSLGRR